MAGMRTEREQGPGRFQWELSLETHGVWKMNSWSHASLEQSLFYHDDYKFAF